MAFGYVLDGIYSGTTAANGTSISLSNAWEVSAFYEHYWNPQWRTSLFGNYSAITYGGAGNAALAAAFAAGSASNSGFGTIVAGTSNGNFNFATAQVGTKTSWQPVKNLTFSAEFLYSRMLPSLTGSFVNLGGISGAPSGATTAPYTIGAQNVYNGAVQVLRSF